MEQVKEQKFELILQMSEQGVVCNAQSLKEMLPNKLKPYEYVVDEYNYDQAKIDRAKLNNMVDLIANKRKDFEKIAFQDWNNAKPILMDIEKTIKACADALGNGVKDVEEKEKLAKMEMIRQDMLAILPNLPIAIEFEKFYDRKAYDKKAMTVKKIKEDIQLKINKVVQDWEMMQLFIVDLNEVEIEQVKESYAEKLDTESVGRAKQKSDQLISLHKKVAEKQAEMNEKSVSEHNISPVEERVEHAQEMVYEQEQSVKTMQRGFVIEGSLEFFKEIEFLIRKHNAKLLKVVKSNEDINRWITMK